MNIKDETYDNSRVTIFNYQDLNEDTQDSLKEVISISFKDSPDIEEIDIRIFTDGRISIVGVHKDNKLLWIKDLREFKIE